MEHNIGRLKLNYDLDWSFSLSDVTKASEVMFDHSSWRMLNLPHDWSIEGSYEKHHTSGKKGGFVPTGVGWYRKNLYIPEEWKEKCVFIEFDGIYMNSDVWINGHHLGKRPYGYMGFEYELTPYLHTGVNVISVRVDCSMQPSSRWYNGSGIYRHVWLTVKEKVHVAHWGTYITTPEVNKSFTRINICTNINNKSNTSKSIILRSSIYASDGTISNTIDTKVTIKKASNTQCNQEVVINQPELWSPDSPSMYSLLTQVLYNGECIDEYSMVFFVTAFNAPIMWQIQHSP